MSTFRKHLWAATAGLAVAAAVPLGANATPLPFTVDPNSVGLTTVYAPFVATDLNGSSDALIQQTAVTTQFEQGWIQGQSFTNNGLGVGSAASGLVTTGSLGAGTGTYNLYATFTATVTGISGFTPGQIGTIGPGAFKFTLFADPGSTDLFNPGSTSATGGTAPTVTDNGTADKILAVGVSTSGTAGFQPTTGAPIFDATAAFIVCDGTANQGFQGPTLITGGAATGCGTFDARNFFILPTPFYTFNFTSTTAGSANNLSPVNFGPPGPPNATLNGIVADVNFTPEPGTLALLGSALLLAGLRRSRGTQL